MKQEKTLTERIQEAENNKNMSPEFKKRYIDFYKACEDLDRISKELNDLLK